jgi:glucosyl-dolichyl phosphate glucuronosyltransferase
MIVSVVVCAYTLDRWDELVAAVDSCSRQTLKPDEVILVVDNNDDLLERASREIKNATVVSNSWTKGLSGARNTGVELSSGDVVAFLDDDAHADEKWLETLIQPFEDQSVAGVGGWIVPRFDGDLPTWFPETFYWILGCSYSGLPPSGASIRNPIGASMAMRRQVFTSIGGFTAGIGRIGRIPLGCEETEICIRYTAKNPNDRFVLQRDALVYHHAPESRLTWHYFWTRCWSEGLSKAAVASLVGARSGLSAERSHVMRAMPRELAENVQLARRDPASAVRRSALVLAGTFIAAVGYLRGTLAVRRSPLVPQEAAPVPNGSFAKPSHP